jgi:hypothetical protein
MSYYIKVDQCQEKSHLMLDKSEFLRSGFEKWLESAEKTLKKQPKAADL